MTLISMVAAVDENYGLGRDNQLLCHLPADLKHFKTLTRGKPVVMGRNTYNSIGKPLPERTNIVISRNKLHIEGVELASSLSEALYFASAAPEVMIIGGAKVYEQALPFTNKIYLTLIHHQFDADVYFPRLDESVWRCSESLFRQRDEKNSYDMTFYCYERF